MLHEGVGVYEGFDLGGALGGWEIADGCGGGAGARDGGEEGRGEREGGDVNA